MFIILYLFLHKFFWNQRKIRYSATFNEFSTSFLQHLNYYLYQSLRRGNCFLHGTIVFWIVLEDALWGKGMTADFMHELDLVHLWNCKQDMQMIYEEHVLGLSMWDKGGMINLIIKTLDEKESFLVRGSPTSTVSTSTNSTSTIFSTIGIKFWVCHLFNIWIEWKSLQTKYYVLHPIYQKCDKTHALFDYPNMP